MRTMSRVQRAIFVWGSVGLAAGCAWAGQRGGERETSAPGFSPSVREMLRAMAIAEERTGDPAVGVFPYESNGVRMLDVTCDDAGLIKHVRVQVTGEDVLASSAKHDRSSRMTPARSSLSPSAPAPPPMPGHDQPPSQLPSAVSAAAASRGAITRWGTESGASGPIYNVTVQGANGARDLVIRDDGLVLLNDAHAEAANTVQ